MINSFLVDDHTHPVLWGLSHLRLSLSLSLLTMHLNIEYIDTLNEEIVLDWHCCHGWWHFACAFVTRIRFDFKTPMLRWQKKGWNTHSPIFLRFFVYIHSLMLC